MDAALKLWLPNGQQVNVAGTRKGALATVRHLPDLATLVAKGKGWSVQDLTTTAILDAPPSTTAGLTVQNPTKDKYYLVVALTQIIDVNPASLASAVMWHCRHKLPAAALTRDITLQATGAGSICGLMAGQGQYPGLIILDRGATVVDDGWQPAGEKVSNVVNSEADYAQKIKLVVPVLIPPDMHYSIATVGGSTTTEAGVGLEWFELDPEDLLID